MRIQHPRSVIEGRTPPSQVSVPGRRGSVTVDEAGHFEINDDRAGRVMRTLAEAYEIEYTDEGEVVLDDEHSDGFDTEEWLAQDYRDRAVAVENGEVDHVLDEVAAIETSETVAEAVEHRREELTTAGGPQNENEDEA